MEGQVSEAISGVAVETLTGEHAFVQGILPRVRSIERRLSGVFDDEDNENAADVDCSSVSAWDIKRAGSDVATRPRARSRFLIFSREYKNGMPECVVRSAVRGAFVSYAFRAAVGFFPVLLKSLIRRKLMGRELLRELFGQQQFQYASFFSASFTAFNTFMYATRGTREAWSEYRALIGGAACAGPALALARKLRAQA